MNKFNFANIEKFWQEQWKNEHAFKQYTTQEGKENYYVLEMLPYPSGKLHMGHVRNYTIGDVIARYKNMNHFNVIHPMGWDSFGLPAENAAIQHGSHPAIWTFANIENMKRQLDLLGFSYDWDREIATCTPEYYRWNQWLFIQMYQKGLAYKKKANVNWCPHDLTVLANEQVEDGACWRCGTPVVQKELEQWFFKITDYSKELLEDLSLLDAGWPEKVVTMQRNWIGKSEGAKINFPCDHKEEPLTVFTTRPDTLFGVTYVVIAPEHPWVQDILLSHPELKESVDEMKREDRFERMNENAEKKGVFSSCYVTHPLTEEKIPVWIANYVLMDYGTGAVMAVPAHDSRDFQFAQKYQLPIQEVIISNTKSPSTSLPFLEEGVLIHSHAFNGLSTHDAKKAISDTLSERGAGGSTTHYRLRDWLVSRQRYWGTPIPFVYCDHCGMVPEKLENLPVTLPNDIEFTENGNPLETSESFKNCLCPQCGNPARRETDTMDTFVDSSWYYFRYITPKENQAMFGKEVNDWLPISQYIGGVEHAVLHLLYARFFTKVLRDLGLISAVEPFKNLLTQGMVLSNSYHCVDCKLYVNATELNETHTCPQCGKPLLVKMEKMSKSKNNGIDPEKIIQEFGADAARLFTLFAAPPERELEWSENGLMGASRFINKFWNFFQESLSTYQKVDTIQLELLSPTGATLYRGLHKTIKKVTSSIENNFHFNAAIAGIMEYLNSVTTARSHLQNSEDQRLISYILKTLTLLLHPFTPFITSEILKDLGEQSRLTHLTWPTYSEALTQDSVVTMGIQVNGKLRGELEMDVNASDDTIREAALSLEKVAKYLVDVEIVKVIIIKKRIVNIVVK